MPRRSQSNVEFLLSLPWWASVVLGVLGFVGSSLFLNHLGQTGGVIGKGIAQGSFWLPFALLGFFGLMALGSALMRWKRGGRLESQTSVESIRSLSWEAFEGLVAEAYQRQGFSIEQLPPGTPDGGIDLILKKGGQTTLVQCKQWLTTSVGARVVREIYGVLMHEGADRAVVITSGDFTREAELFVQGKPIELIDGGRLFEMIRDVQAAPRVPRVDASQQTACPECGQPMVLRTAKRGANAGNSFWGCSTYPKCKGTRSA